MITIIPAILAKTEEEYKEKLSKIEKSGAFEGGFIQIDLMDEKFVDNKSIGTHIISKYPTKLKKEAHLMVNFPESWIDGLAKAKVDRIIFPVEDVSSVPETIKQIKDMGLEVGLAINPETKVESVMEFLATIDVVLVMSVQPGFGGQEFLPEAIEKIKKLSDTREKESLDFLIEVDGGINLKNATEVIDAGANGLVMGSHLLEGNIDENIEKIWETLN